MPLYRQSVKLISSLVYKRTCINTRSDTIMNEFLSVKRKWDARPPPPPIYYSSTDFNVGKFFSPTRVVFVVHKYTYKSKLQNTYRYILWMYWEKNTQALRSLDISHYPVAMRNKLLSNEPWRRSIFNFIGEKPPLPPVEY